MARTRKEYALYRGEDLVAMGTVSELSEELGVKPQTVLFYGTPSYLNRTNELKSRRLVRIG